MIANFMLYSLRYAEKNYKDKQSINNIIKKYEKNGRVKCCDSGT